MKFSFSWNMLCVQLADACCFKVTVVKAKVIARLLDCSISKEAIINGTKTCIPLT